MAINYILQGIIFPPTSLILLAFLGLLLLKRRPGLGKTLIASALMLLTLASSKPVAHLLTLPLIQYNALSEDQLQADQPQAIVIMGGGARRYAPDYDHQDTVSRYSLERIRYGAMLARKTGLPILVTGGRVFVGADRPSEAELMAKTLEEEFQVPVKWTETESRNSFENADFSYKMLAALGVKRIVLVTHASHMMRSVEAFEHVGFQVSPAPTGLPATGPDAPSPTLKDWIPSASGLYSTFMALHEWLGMLWYRWRYY